MNNFERGQTKVQSCEVWSKSNQWFKRCHLKKLFTDARMQTDARWTDDGYCNHKSSPCHYVTGQVVTGELKIKKTSQNYHQIFIPYKSSAKSVAHLWTEKWKRQNRLIWSFTVNSIHPKGHFLIMNNIYPRPLIIHILLPQTILVL